VVYAFEDFTSDFDHISHAYCPNHLNSLKAQNITLLITLRAAGGSLTTSFFTAEQMLPCTINQSHYRPEMPRGFQEVKVPRLRDNGPEMCAKFVSLTHRPFLPPGNTAGTHFC